MKRATVLIVMASLAAPVPGAAQTPTEVLLRPAATLEEPFSWVRGVVGLRDGRVLVADQRETAIYLAAFGGAPRVQLGRNGQGPGEYQAPVGLFAGPADTAIANDIFNGRFAVVTPDGVVGTIPLGSVAPSGARPHMLDGQRRGYWDDGIRVRRLKLRRPGAPESDVKRLMRSTADRVDTLASLLIPGPANPGPIPEWDLWSAGEDGWVAIVRNQDSYRVDWVTPEGRTITGPVVPESRVDIGRRDRARLEKDRGSGVRTGGSGDPGRGTAYVPDRFPFALGVAVSPEREAWVRRALPGEDPPPTYDVFDSAGRRIARYRLPEGRVLVGFGDRTLYATREDEVGLIWLERYAYPVRR